MESKITAIVPSAGLGKRFSASVRKPFARVAGIPILIYTLKKLHASRSITEIIPVLKKEDMAKGFKLFKLHNLKKIKQIAPGGKERQDSVRNALGLIKESGFILIHDGVRPLVSKTLIERLLNEMEELELRCAGFGGVVPGLPVKETLKEVDIRRCIVRSTVKRERIWSIQTPQVFPFAVIQKAYRKAYADGFYAADDAALVERIGKRVKIIAGDPLNVKITTPEDMEMAEFLLSKKDR